MQAIRVLIHALQQVFGNLRQALVMSALPIMVGLAAGFGLFVIGAFSHRQDGSVSGFLFMVFLIFVLLMAWLAVRWHRFVLLDGRENLFAPPSRVDFWRYVGALLRMILIIVPAVLVLFGLLMLLVRSSGSAVISVIAMVTFSILFFALNFILGTGLAGAAVGAPKPLRTAWKKLEPAGGTLLLLSLATLIGSELLEAAMHALANNGWPQPLKIIIPLITYWLTTLLGLSVLTTLWGHYVEGRPLR